MNLEREEEFVEIDLREYLKVLLENKELIISIFILALVSSLIVSYFVLDSVYQSQATIKLGNRSKEYSNPKTASNILTSLDYLKKVNEKLSLGVSTGNLSNWKGGKLQVESPNNRLIEVSFNDPDPQRAKLVVEELIKLFRKESEVYFKQTKELEEERLAEIKTEIDKIEREVSQGEVNVNKLKEANLSTLEKIIFNSSLQSLRQTKLSLIEKRYKVKQKINELEKVKIINAPVVPEDPIKPNKKLNLVIAGVLGLILGVFIVFFKEFLQETN